MTPHDLIVTARRTVATGPGAPKQSDLRRATSTAYYALFHCLARCCADTFAGKGRALRRAPAWRQAYRALEHGNARAQCTRPYIRTFPPRIRSFAESFTDLQGKRHLADYDPFGRWVKGQVEEDIDGAEGAIEDFERTPAQDRRAFAVYVLLKYRDP